MRRTGGPFTTPEFEVQPGGLLYAYTAQPRDYYVWLCSTPLQIPPRAPILFASTARPVGEVVAAGEPGITFQNPFPARIAHHASRAEDGTRAHVGIYDVQGRLVRTLFGRVGRQGRPAGSWDGRGDGVHARFRRLFCTPRSARCTVNRTLL